VSNEAHTLLGLVIQYNYIELYHFLKLWSVSMCQCPRRVWCMCMCFIDEVFNACSSVLHGLFHSTMMWLLFLKLWFQLMEKLYGESLWNCVFMTGSWDFESCEQESEASVWYWFAFDWVVEIVFGIWCCSDDKEFLHCLYRDGFSTC
jgi:hypothetical protein